MRLSRTLQTPLGILSTLVALWGCREAPRPGAPSAGRSAATARPAFEESVTPEREEPLYAVDRAGEAIAAAIARGGLPKLARRGLPPPDSQFAQVYRDGFIPVWVTADGRPNAAAGEAMAALRQSATEGLRPTDYQLDRLDSLAAFLSSANAPSPAEIGRFDAVLTAAVLRFATDLHGGRIDPRDADADFRPPPDLHNVPGMVAVGISDHRVGETLASLRPSLVQYQRLRDALALYRALVDSTLPSIPASTASVKPGARWPGLGALHRRLVLERDLPATTPAPPDSAPYDSLLAAGVRRFQDRHGLEADGVIGKATVAALNVPFTRRVQQIELGLERLRWLPDLESTRFILVNIPTFQLWAWDSLRVDGVPTLSMNVVVGRSMKAMTPVMQEELAYLVFRPYWNVPRSIVTSEVLPRLRRDPGYLARNEMELVAGGENPAPLAATPANIDRLSRGQLRVRQRPGPKNSLGLVKFIFPNDQAVYLHDTPATELFGRTRRDFSHGCVRVERPAELAEWALRERAGWTRKRVVEAMQSGKTQTVTLPRHIPVFLFYTTAIAGPDGAVRFAEDIYGRDARLLQALEAP